MDSPFPVPSDLLEAQLWIAAGIPLALGLILSLLVLMVQLAYNRRSWMRKAMELRAELDSLPVRSTSMRWGPNLMDD